MVQSPTKWVDSTIVGIPNFKPIYHSSYNQQCDMVLRFDHTIKGFYLDKQSGVKTEVLENADKPFFDSNFYPHFILLLPLEQNYTHIISIFDYNPKSSIHFLTATIKNTEKGTLESNGKVKKVWKVQTTDDISGNSVISTYYIDIGTRKTLKQEISFGSRKMVMKAV